MLKPTPQEFAALAQLRNTAAHAYIRRTYEATKELLVTHGDPETIKVLQGHAQFARGLLEHIEPEGFSTNGKRG